MGNQYTDFFNPQGPQVGLYEDLLNEAIGFYGTTSLYMVRESLSNFDTIFGDDPTKLFKQAYEVPVYVETVEQFEGFEAISKFGYEVRKQARFLVATRTFNLSMPPGFGRPREGDIIWLKNFKAFFEIKKADEEHIFYTFGNQDIYGYSMVCEKWNYDQATVNTGYATIDSTVNNIVISYEFKMNPATGVGSYLLDEDIRGNTSGATATVTSWNRISGDMIVKYITSEFVVGESVVGVKSNAVFTLTSLNIRDNINDGLDDNQELANESDTFLEFDSDNPFGVPQE